MNFRNYIRALFLTVFVVCAIGCSDDDPLDNINDPIDNGGGAGGEGDGDNGETTDPTENRLGTPAELKCTNKNKTEATVSWRTVSGAVGYEVVVEGPSSNQIVSEVVTATKRAITGLTEATIYTVSVQALAGEDSDTLDSDIASISFQTCPTNLTAPDLKVISKSHALAIMEWNLSDEAISEQPLIDNPYGSGDNSSDTYNFRLCDSSGKVLREVDGFNDFYFKDYIYFRLAWGGLTPSTTYRLEMQRVSTEHKDLFYNSDWASVEVTTDPAPDTSGYLLYWDFDNVPFNANALHMAYGFARVTDWEDDWAHPDNMTYSANYTDNSVAAQAISKNVGQSFFDQYFPGLNVSDMASSASYKEGTFYNIRVQAGHMAINGNGAAAWLSLPACSTLSANSTIYLELDSCPYANSGGGDPLNPWNSDKNEWFYVWAPGAKIESVEGETADDAMVDSTDEGLVKLRNVLVTHTMKEYSDANPYHYTNHKIKISGVGPTTRIVIYGALSGSDVNRYWMDNIKISLAD